MSLEDKLAENTAAVEALHGAIRELIAAVGGIKPQTIKATKQEAPATKQEAPAMKQEAPAAKHETPATKQADTEVDLPMLQKAVRELAVMNRALAVSIVQSYEVKATDKIPSDKYAEAYSRVIKAISDAGASA